MFALLGGEAAEGECSPACRGWWSTRPKAVGRFWRPVTAPGSNRRCNQAVGALMVQLDLQPSDAFARLCAHAFLPDAPIDQAAEEIVTGRLRSDGNARPR